MEYGERETDCIVLSSFSEIGYSLKKLLLSDFSHTPDFAKFEKALIKTLGEGVYNKVKRLFGDRAYRADVLQRLEQKNVFCVTPTSAAYPALLKEIPDPPFVLYGKGNASLLSGKCFSVVGSRRSSPKTLACCKNISRELTGSFHVVTGIASGADSAAIAGALPSGKLVCVLAGGFDHIYPSENASLAQRIAGAGLLLSEYPPEETVRPYHFPVRNRIIAGLSVGTLVVSAGEKSGALITADFAADYGRDVFAFPHTPGESDGAGCNSLIKNGAYLAENILDICQVYGLDLKMPEKQELTEDERVLLEAIRGAGEAFLPAVAEALKKQPYQLAAVISSLEIKGLVVRLGGNRYAAV